MMDDEPMLNQEVEELCAHMDGTLDAAYHRMGMDAPRHNGRPMMAMLRSSLPDTNDEEYVIWLEAWREFLNFLFDQGPRPDRVLRRLFAITWCVNREKLANMSQSDLAVLFKEGRAAQQLRIKVVYSDFLRSRGFRGVKVPGQKSESACENFARRQMGNKNRQTGRKKGDTPASARLKTKRPKSKRP